MHSASKSGKSNPENNCITLGFSTGAQILCAREHLKFGGYEFMKKFIKRHNFLLWLLAGPLACRRAWMNWRLRPVDVALDRLGEIVRSNLIFEAKEFGGVFSINPRSHLLRRLLQQGYYEPRISSLYFRFLNPEGDILDIGANVGFFTIGGAKKLSTARILAAEPTSEAFDRLRENVERNGIGDRVILFKGLVGSWKGQTEVNYVPGLEEYSSVNALEHFATKNHEARTEKVPIERLDDLVAAHDLRPTLIKVDVEGGELSVFQGAEHTLSTFRPIVISELWRRPVNAGGRTGADVVGLFEKLDYVVRDPHDPLAKPGLYDIGEIICIPKEKFRESMLE
jgi:FkbM family methyltransferase